MFLPAFRQRHVTTNKIAKILTFATGAELELVVPHAAEADSLALAGPNRIELSVPDLADRAELWQLNSSASLRSDGILQLVYPAGNKIGSAFMKRPVSVTNAWTAVFSTAAVAGRALNSQGDGICFVLQNDARGTTAFSTNYTGFGYYEGTRFTTQVKMYTNGIMQIASTDISPVSLINKQHASMTVAHDAAAGTVTVITEQAAGAYANIITGVNMAAAVGAASAYLGFGAATGGSFAENIVRDFSFESEGGASDTSWQRGYLALGAATGSGTLVKKDNAALGIQDGPDNPFTNATIRLDEGGLVLRKLVYEPVTLGDDFYLSKWASWAPGGAPQTMFSLSTIAGNAVTGSQYVHALVLEDVAMPGGTYTAAHVSWLTGPGMLVVTYPPVGSMLFLM